jgi:hypothetical protein
METNEGKCPKCEPLEFDWKEDGITIASDKDHKDAEWLRESPVKMRDEMRQNLKDELFSNKGNGADAFAYLCAVPCMKNGVSDDVWLNNVTQNIEWVPMTPADGKKPLRTSAWPEIVVLWGVIVLVASSIVLAFLAAMFSENP